MEVSPSPWSLWLRLLRTRVLKCKQRRLSITCQIQSLCINYSIVPSLKADPRCLGAVLNCWLARAETVSLKGAAGLLSFISWYKGKTSLWLGRDRRWKVNSFFLFLILESTNNVGFSYKFLFQMAYHKTGLQEKCAWTSDCSMNRL